MATAQRTYRQQTTAQRRAERRARLLDAAVDAFGTRGFAATSIEQLCADGNLSTRNFYENFRSREELLLELHDNLNDRAFDAVIGALADVDPMDPHARAVAGVQAYLSVMIADRRWARIAVIETIAVSAATEKHRRRALDRFADLLVAEFDRFAELGVVGRRDYRLAALGVVGALTELVTTCCAAPNPQAVLDDVAAEAVRFVLAAIGLPR
jgi:AcrR family transcriptional regulator